jgi:tRNA pseudouridine13 synthase
MKVKQLPDDFRVEELTEIVPGQRGDFAFYRLDKRGWTTPDALALIRRRWQLPPSRLGYGGLKDRHAWTSQFFTVHHGPRRNLSQQGIEVRYLGQVEQAFDSAGIRANRFQITLRALSPAEVEAARLALPQIQRSGVPNFFDDQRFGSVEGPEGEFIGRLLVRGQFEEALKLALTGPYEYDTGSQRREKATLLRHWGDWIAARDALPRGHARSLVDYLTHHPGDFRGAVVRLRPELRGLYLSAYQSHLWNRILSRWLRANVPADQLLDVSLRMGPLPFPVDLAPEIWERWRALSLPLPSARLHLPEDDPCLPHIVAVLAEEGLTLKDLQVRGVRELFFSKGERPALCLPEGLRLDEGADDLNSGRQRLVLAFDLPRGCYATLIVKRLSAGARPG